MPADLNTALYLWIVLAVILLPVQLFVTAPYGRHSLSTWGPSLSNKLAWVIMESSALFGMLIMLAIHHPGSAVAWIAASLWILHYINRAIIYPLRIRTAGKRMPLVVMLMALTFNAVNSLINGAFLSTDAVHSPDVGMVDLQSICGVLIFLLGFAINVLSDNRLLKLRAGNSGEYKIPRGGLFERVSCPNFLGEIIEWIGFAVLCWNLPALAFAIWTAVNLIPRAIAHHRWYSKRFADYPSGRKAILPYIL